MGGVTRAWGTRFVAFTASFAMSGCFFYDSSWGQAKKAQQSQAKDLSATQLRADEATAAPQKLKVLTAKLLVTSDYAAQNVDARKQITDVVEEVNRILGTNVGARLDVEIAASTDPVKDDLRAELDALAARDPGSDFDYVIEFVGNLPRATVQFHELGVAQILGRFAVVRSVSNAEEFDWIEKSLGELSDEERSRVRRHRKHHKAAAILLHEIGHTLGAVHETAPTSVMFPAYRATMERLGEGNVALMRAALPRHRETLRPDYAKELLRILDEEAPRASWVPADRDSFAALLRAIATAPSPSTPRATDPPKPSPIDEAELAPLTASDRETFGRALAIEKTDPNGAWSAAEPLFARYPKVFVVQDLRCRLASGRFAWTRARVECEPTMMLTRDPSRKK